MADDGDADDGEWLEVIEREISMGIAEAGRPWKSIVCCCWPLELDDAPGLMSAFGLANPFGPPKPVPTIPTMLLFLACPPLLLTGLMMGDGRVFDRLDDALPPSGAAPAPLALLDVPRLCDRPPPAVLDDAVGPIEPLMSGDPGVDR